jgi:hypothetical protein
MLKIETIPLSAVVVKSSAFLAFVMAYCKRLRSHILSIINNLELNKSVCRISGQRQQVTTRHDTFHVTHIVRLGLMQKEFSKLVMSPHPQKNRFFGDDMLLRNVSSS